MSAPTSVVAFTRLLLRPLSQTSGFESLRRPGEAPDTIPAPEALPALVMLFALQVTSLSGITRRDRGCVRGSSEPAPFASGIARGNSPMISGDRMEKRPLTHRPQSFAVRHRLLHDSLTSPRGPFMVELFTVERFAPDRRSFADTPDTGCSLSLVTTLPDESAREHLKAGARAAFLIRPYRY